ncbi:MAG TPA: crosslink repair DNA glycosylase YcaQ family protein [Ktedonobacterales bacterium]
MARAIERADDDSAAMNAMNTRNGRRAAQGTARAAHAPELALTLDEACGVMLAAQRLDAPGDWFPPGNAATADDLAALIETLGVVQIDTISVAARSQYLVLWARLGAYQRHLLDQLLHPNRAIFEYWSHAASILPMADYRWYRQDMLAATERHMWEGVRDWMERNPTIIAQTLERIRAQGPMASADFERPDDGRRAEAWDWFGVKESRRALDVLWTNGDIMVHSRRAGQKVYDTRERVLAEAFAALGEPAPDDDALPDAQARLDYFAHRTVRALGVVTPSWLWDYFRLREYDMLAHPEARGSGRNARATGMLEAMARAGTLVPAAIEGIPEPAWVAVESLDALQRLRAGATPGRTTLLSPFDSLIWHRARAQALFNYEVAFEAYIVPEKRRYGYYCLAILHRGRLVGRLDPKMDRKEHRLIARALYLEPGVKPSADLLDGIASALRDLAAFLGATTIAVEKTEPVTALKGLRKRLA